MERIGSGTLLAGRYRLEEQVSVDQLTATWRAQDLTLERTVAVRLLSQSHVRVPATLDAARRAVLVEDRRLQRVLGVGTEVGNGFVVLEWIAGQSVAELAGSVHEQEAVVIVREVAESLRAAASRGLHHLHLTPATVLRDDDELRDDEGRIRVTGLAIDAAAAGDGGLGDPTDDEAHDVRDLGALLYALITSCWPFGYSGGLRAAPTDDDAPLPPSALAPGTSAELDRLVHSLVAGGEPRTLDGLLAALMTLDGTSGTSATGTASTAAAATAAAAEQEADTVELEPLPRTEADGTAPVPTVVTMPDTEAARVRPTASVPARARDRPAAAPPAAAVRPTAPPPADDGWSLLPVDEPFDQHAPQKDAPVRDHPREATPPAGAAAGPYAPTAYGAASALPGGGTPTVDTPGASPLTTGPLTTGERHNSGAGTGVAVVLVVAAFVVSGLVWALDSVQADAPDAPPVVAAEPTVAEEPTADVAPPAEPEAQPTTPEVRSITPAGAQVLDPFGDRSENDQEATRAIDRDPATAWTSEGYSTQAFGGLKDGVGLVVDLGAVETVLSVDVVAAGAGGTYEVRSAATPSFEGSTVIGTGATGAPVTVTPEAPVQTRFVVIWFTALADGGGGDWRARLNEVQVQVQ